MRTDRRSNAENRAGGRLSRRTVLLAGGAAVGTVVGGTASGRTTASERAIVVAATEPYLPAVRTVVEARTRLGVDLRLAGESGDAPAVLVAGRPLERAGTRRDVRVDRWAVLAHPDGEWRDCLRRSEVRERWAGETPVEFWSETAWERVDEGGLDCVTPTDERSGDRWSVLVSGTRPYQYARGRGGVGHYSVDRDVITDGAAVTADDPYTPVVRIGYRHVDRDALADERVATFLQRYDRHTGEVDDAEFVESTVDG